MARNIRRRNGRDEVRRHVGGGWRSHRPSAVDCDGDDTDPRCPACRGRLGDVRDNRSAPRPGLRRAARVGRSGRRRRSRSRPAPRSGQRAHHGRTGVRARSSRHARSRGPPGRADGNLDPARVLASIARCGRGGRRDRQQPDRCRRVRRSERACRVGRCQARARDQRPAHRRPAARARDPRGRRTRDCPASPRGARSGSRGLRRQHLVRCHDHARSRRIGLFGGADGRGGARAHRSTRRRGWSVARFRSGPTWTAC